MATAAPTQAVLEAVQVPKLFHGTLTSLVPSILKNGLRPRGQNPSHDEHRGLPSLPDMVYLTSSEGLALSHAIRISEMVHQSADVTVLEVNGSVLDRSLFYPDEDWVKVELNSDSEDWKHERSKVSRKNRYLWEDCLRDAKTVAYRGVVPPSTIRIAPDIHLWQGWVREEYRSMVEQAQNEPALGTRT